MQHDIWVELVRQSPAVAGLLIVGWFVHRQMTRQHADHVTDLRRDAEEKVRLLKEAQQQHVDSLRAELTRLEADRQAILADRDRLRKQLEKRT